MTDRHKAKPKAVRMPGGLLAWYEGYAGRTGMSVNAALVGALEAFRQASGDGAATLAARPENGAAAGPGRGQRVKVAAPPPMPVPPPPPAPGSRTAQCPPHPKARVVKGLCGACGTYVGQ